jgi:nitroreductase/SAM-dependent methyltransferase
VDVFEAIRHRRSVRRFTAEAVSEVDLQAILEAARWAPSACNCQLGRFIVMRRERLGRLTDCAGPVVDLNPAACIWVLHDRRYNPEHGAWIQSAAAAVQNMLLAAHALGLGAVWMCGYGDERAVKRRLNIPRQYEVLAAVLIGQPAERFSAPSRRPARDVIAADRFVWRGEAAGFPRSWHPRAWTYPQIQHFVNYSIRAKSPTPQFNRPFLPWEFRSELSLIPALGGRTLFFGPYAGNYLLALRQEKRLSGRVEAAVYAEEVGRFLGEKAADMGLELADEVSVFDGRRLPQDDASLDNLFCAHQLERFSDRRALVAEFARVLKPGGRLILLTSNALAPYYLIWRLRRLLSDLGPGLRGPFCPQWPWHREGLPHLFRAVLERGVCLFPFTRWEGKVYDGRIRLLAKTLVTIWKRK